MFLSSFDIVSNRVTVLSDWKGLAKQTLTPETSLPYTAREDGPVRMGLAFTGPLAEPLVSGPCKPGNVGSSMFKQFLFFLIGLLVGFAACRLSQKTPEPWIPVLEGTSFVYLSDPLARAIKAAQAAKERIESNQVPAAGEELQETIDSLSRLQFYFIPMTETRQLVYDADRLFFLGHVPEAKRKLAQAKDFLREIGEAEHYRLRKPANELVLLLDELLLTIEQAPGEAPAKFRLVGNRVNLMLLKGDLVLSGAGIAE